MRYLTNSDHQLFFSQRRFIEFENLLSNEEATKIKENADLLLAARLKTEPALLEHKTPREIFMAGRDFWRADPFLKKIIAKPKLGEIATTLFKQTPLRLAYVQILRSTAVPGQIFDKPYTLQHTSCFKNIVGGLVLRLSDGPASLTTSADFCPFPSQIGSGIFLSAGVQLSFDPFFLDPAHALLLIVYCNNRTMYTLEKNDPFTHALKREGYVFGDRLKHATHPIIYR